MKRLDAIVSWLNGYQTAIDIGTDHGLVLKKALDLNYIKNGIAADLREGPLLSARKNLSYYPVEFVLSNGFERINHHFDVGIITGMGANLIAEILKGAPADTKIIYILGANDKPHLLREWLSNNQFRIIDETIIFDGLYYQLIKVIRGNASLSKSDIYLGPILKNRLTSLKFYNYQLNYYQNLLTKVPLSGHENLNKIISYYQVGIKKLKMRMKQNVTII